ncbi:MAG: ATP-dependent DNA helicase [Micrococcaceae bacterium]
MKKTELSTEQISEILGKEFPPTEEQKKIIVGSLEPQLVVAGAGSGKTETMSARVMYLVVNGLARPEEILGVTFTKKAATELSKRVQDNLQNLANAGVIEADLMQATPTTSTYHSYAQGIVREYGVQLGYESDTKLISPTDTWLLSKKIVDEYTGETSHIKAAQSTLYDEVVNFSSQCAEHLKTPTEVKEYIEDILDRYEKLPPGVNRENALDRDFSLKLKTKITIAELAEELQAEKATRGEMDFGDLISLAAAIAKKIPQAGKAERSKYKVVLLDEFQDTSVAQMQLFRKLFGADHAMTAVGDPNQSIYGWRGASAGGMQRFINAFGSASKPISPDNLSTSWRNTTKILDAANKIVNYKDPEEAQIVDVLDSAGAGILKVDTLKPRENSPNGEVWHGRFETDKAEAEAIADFIAQRWHNRSTKRKENDPLTFSVLCRRRARFNAIEEALAARDIPTEIIGLAGLLDTPEVIDLVAMLKVLSDLENPSSLMRVLMGARWRISPADLNALNIWARDLSSKAPQVFTSKTPEGYIPEPVDNYSLVEAIDGLPHDYTKLDTDKYDLSEIAHERLCALATELRELRAFQNLELPEFVYKVMTKIRLDIEIAVKPSGSSITGIRHLNEFLDVTQDFYEGNGGSLVDFLLWLEAAKAKENGLTMPEQEASKEAVQISTIHGAKGLEWDVVVVPELNENTFPKVESNDWITNLAQIPWEQRGDAKELPRWSLEQVPQTKRAWAEAWGYNGKPKKDEAETREHETKTKNSLKNKSKCYGEKEERRLAYVAYTRAKSVLVLTSFAFVSTAKSKRQVSRYLTELELGNENILPGSIAEEEIPDTNPLVEDENIITAVWPYDPLGPRRDAIASAAEAINENLKNGIANEIIETDDEKILGWRENIAEVFARAEADKPDNSVPFPTRVSASSVYKLVNDPEKFAKEVRRPMPQRPYRGAELGNAFHEWVEDFYAQKGQIKLNISMIDDPEIEDTAGIVSADAIANFKNSHWANESNNIVEIEAPIEFSLNGVTIIGRIDVIFKEDDGYRIVDWKTGEPSKSKDKEYAMQLATYRVAYAKLKGIDPSKIKATLYFVDVDQDKDIDEDKLLSQEKLEGMINDIMVNDE